MVGIEHLIWMLDERLARAEQSAIDSRGSPNSYGHGYDEGFWEALVDARTMAELVKSESLSQQDHDAFHTRIQAIIHRTMMSAPYPGGYRDSQVRVAADEIIELGGTTLSSNARGGSDGAA